MTCCCPRSRGQEQRVGNTLAPRGTCLRATHCSPLHTTLPLLAADVCLGPYVLNPDCRRPLCLGWLLTWPCVPPSDLVFGAWPSDVGEAADDFMK